MTRETWRFLPYDVGPTGRHLALSDALVRLVRQPTVWFHSTSQRTLILGKSGRRDEAIFPEDVIVVARQSGGTAVLAEAGVVGLDVALPRAHSLVLPDIVESYAWFGKVWRRALHSVDVPARLVSVPEAREAESAVPADSAIRLACFGTLSPYEVISEDGRKLVGLAQVRRSTGTLLQSAVHLHLDATALARLIAPVAAEETARSLRVQAIGIDEATGRSLSEQDLIDAFSGALEKCLGVRLEPGDWTPEELRHAQAYLDQA